MKSTLFYKLHLVTWRTHALTVWSTGGMEMLLNRSLGGLSFNRSGKQDWRRKLKD